MQDIQERIKIEPEWKSQLFTEFEKPYMNKLRDFLKKCYESKKVIYPKGANIFNALNFTPYSKVKVVILGQDPYHGPNQAHGLSFSVQNGVKNPPSLVNIFKELESDLGISPSKSGDLTRWAKQGVLLLNATLTVEAAKAGSHQGKGWEEFTDEVIKRLNKHPNPLVFILWGSYAQKKGVHLDAKKHLIIKSPHPSPLSAHRGFFGSRPFSKSNAFLRKNQLKEIDWNVN